VLKVGHAFQQSTDYHLRQAPALTGELQPAE
jgi:hypothetical protein